NYNRRPLGTEQLLRPAQHGQLGSLNIDFHHVNRVNIELSEEGVERSLLQNDWRFAKLRTKGPHPETTTRGAIEGNAIAVNLAGDARPSLHSHAIISTQIFLEY